MKGALLKGYFFLVLCYLLALAAWLGLVAMMMGVFVHV